MAKIMSVNLNKNAAKIYIKIGKIRHKGWFSKDVNEMLEKKYGNEKKQLLEELLQKQAQRDDIESEIKTLAKKINLMKDD